MKKISILLITLALLVSVVTSCKKDDPAPTKTELLTKASWTGTIQKEYTNGTLTDTYSIADVKLLFKTNGTLDEYENNVLVGSGTWTFIDNETKIQFIVDDTVLLNIDTLDENNMVLSDTETSGGVTTKYVSSFVH